MKKLKVEVDLHHLTVNITNDVPEAATYVICGRKMETGSNVFSATETPVTKDEPLTWFKFFDLNRHNKKAVDAGSYYMFVLAKNEQGELIAEGNSEPFILTEEMAERINTEHERLHGSTETATPPASTTENAEEVVAATATTEMEEVLTEEIPEESPEILAPSGFRVTMDGTRIEWDSLNTNGYGVLMYKSLLETTDIQKTLETEVPEPFIDFGTAFSNGEIEIGSQYVLMVYGYYPQNTTGPAGEQVFHVTSDKKLALGEKPITVKDPVPANEEVTSTETPQPPTVSGPPSPSTEEVVAIALAQEREKAAAEIRRLQKEAEQALLEKDAQLAKNVEDRRTNQLAAEENLKLREKAAEKTAAEIRRLEDEARKAAEENRKALENVTAQMTAAQRELENLRRTATATPPAPNATAPAATQAPAQQQTAPPANPAAPVAPQTPPATPVTPPAVPGSTENTPTAALNTPWYQSWYRSLSWRHAGIAATVALLLCAIVLIAMALQTEKPGVAFTASVSTTNNEAVAASLLQLQREQNERQMTLLTDKLNALEKKITSVPTSTKTVVKDASDATNGIAIIGNDIQVSGTGTKSSKHLKGSTRSGNTAVGNNIIIGDGSSISITGPKEWPEGTKPTRTITSPPPHAKRLDDNCVGWQEEIGCGDDIQMDMPGWSYLWEPDIPRSELDVYVHTSRGYVRWNPSDASRYANMYIDHVRVRIKPEFRERRPVSYFEMEARHSM